jgi:hypothetical protein
VQWCLREDFNVPHSGEFNSWVLIPNKNSNLYIIDSWDDAKVLFDLYSYQPMEDWTEMLMLDFTKMPEEWDGIHLTARGQEETRFDFNMTGVNLYGWDCESTIWFNFNFEKVECLGSMKFNIGSASCV